MGVRLYQTPRGGLTVTDRSILGLLPPHVRKKKKDGLGEWNAQSRPPFHHDRGRDRQNTSGNTAAREFHGDVVPTYLRASWSFP